MRVDRLVCLAGDDATAFCAGLLRPRVYLTEGVVRVLDPGALDAVLVHESAHARRRDPLRRLCVHATSAPLLGLLTRGQAQGAFRDDLPVQWLVTVFYSLIHAAAAEVQARRLSAKAAPDILADTLLAALRRQPSASEG
jgi:Zn-dependent protease with chaperone function